MEKRIKLQLELEQLNSVPENDLEQAADLLENFKAHWDRLEGDDDGRYDLVNLIVERVYVQDDKIVAMTLRSNYHLVLNHKANGPTYFEVDPLYAHGSDGLGNPAGCRCMIWASRADYSRIIFEICQKLAMA
jgi:hypothetical protein